MTSISGVGYRKVHPAYKLAVQVHGLPPTHASPGSKFRLTKRLRLGGLVYLKGESVRLERVLAVKSISPGLPLFKMRDGRVFDIQLRYLEAL